MAQKEGLVVVELREGGSAVKTKVKRLGAAPGDVDAFMREVSDSVIVGIERAFERAGLTVDGKPLGARARVPERSFEEEFDTVERREAELYRQGVPQEQARAQAEAEFSRLNGAYAWFARQFVRGAKGLGAVDWAGGVHRDIDYLATDDHPGGYRGPPEMFLQGPESLLGLDLWRLGRNVASEAEGRARISGVTDRVGPAVVLERIAFYRDRVLESVRARLNWPRLPDDYDPPPPAQWPKGELDGNEEGSSYSTWARRRFRK